jgi:L-alanine-DL-glutamate epimerase-like enolase superfamily enzyme
MLDRRSFLKSSLLGLAGAGLGTSLRQALGAALPKMKITRVRFYESPISRPMVNQSFHIVTVETDQGITGIGEGGYLDGVRECAEMLIGEDPANIDRCWQLMFRGRFYPAGREKLDAMGALDLALWDIKGKALGVPVYELLGGKSRDHVECYSTGFIPNKGSLKETAKATIDEGFRAFRTSVTELPGNDPTFSSQRMVRKTHELCVAIREAIGPDADWCLDYHTRLDFPDAVRLSTLLEPLEPYFCEDLVRSENPGVYRQLRPQVKVPIAVGEQFGTRWDINELIEGRLIDYNRVSIPNCGGITEYAKLAALCETHYVGLTPHFTGPVSEAALVHVCAAFSGPVMMELAGTYKLDIPYLPRHFDYRNGKLWPNERPGLGVEFDATKLKLTAEFTTRNQPIKLLRRPDGSLTNW